MRNVLKRNFLVQEFFFCDFSFRDVVDFVLNIRSVLVWDLDEFRYFFMFWGTPPHISGCFNVKSP